MHGLRISQVLIGFVKIPVNKITVVEPLSIFSPVVRFKLKQICHLISQEVV
jgi:hypothetical protein